MKKMTVLIAALFALTAPLASFAAMDHGSMDMSHGDHSMMEKGDVKVPSKPHNSNGAFISPFVCILPEP